MVPRVEFKFDKEKDLWNIWSTANSKRQYGFNSKKDLTSNITKICKNKKYEACKKQLMNTMNPIYKHGLAKQLPKIFSDEWGKIQIEYFKRLEKVTKQKFSFNKINAYLTTSGRCPYNPNSRPPMFYVGFFNGIPFALRGSGHELMHIHLHNIDWWQEVDKELGNKKTHDLKEALTELLNHEFRDLWIVNDNSYPNHVKLREYISKQWKKKKDFDLLTANCIKWIKRNGVK